MLLNENTCPRVSDTILELIFFLLCPLVMVLFCKYRSDYTKQAFHLSMFFLCISEPRIRSSVYVVAVTKMSHPVNIIYYLYLFVKYSTYSPNSTHFPPKQYAEKHFIPHHLFTIHFYPMGPLSTIAAGFTIVPITSKNVKS